MEDIYVKGSGFHDTQEHYVTEHKIMFDGLCCTKMEEDQSMRAHKVLKGPGKMGIFTNMFPGK